MNCKILPPFHKLCSWIDIGSLNCTLFLPHLSFKELCRCLPCIIYLLFAKWPKSRVMISYLHVHPFVYEAKYVFQCTTILGYSYYLLMTVSVHQRIYVSLYVLAGLTWCWWVGSHLMVGIALLFAGAALHVQELEQLRNAL